MLGTRVILSPSSSNLCLTVPKFRFFETTGLGVLATLIQHYKVEPHPKFAGESFEQLKERYSKAALILTLT